MEHKKVIEAFTYIPSIINLRCFVCESYPCDSLILPSFHSTYICRLILNKICNVLVAPNNNNNTIYIICSKNDSVIEKIKRMPNLKGVLQFFDPEVLTFEIYEKCLAYSILTKVSPEWIEIDKYYIRCEDFIDYKESVEAVEVKIVVHNITTLRLELTAVTVNIKRYFEPKTCTPNCWKRYNESRTGYLNITCSQQVYCLPIMNKGQIISVCKKIDHNSFRTDWLNQYGYTLPDENELSYCKVKHEDFEHDFMVYPSACLLAEPLYVTENKKNSRHIIATFLKVFIRSNNYICGQVMELMGKQELDKIKEVETIEQIKNVEEFENLQKLENLEMVELNERFNSTLSDQTIMTDEELKNLEMNGSKESLNSNLSDQTTITIIDKSKTNYEWEECNECSQVIVGTQNFDTIVSIPFDCDSINSIQHPTSTTKK